MCCKRNASAALIAVALIAGPGLAAGTTGGSAVDRQGKTLRVGIVADTSPAGAALVAGAERAAAERNATHGIPRLELHTVRPSRSWQDGASTLARLVFTEDLAVLVGSPDAAAAHAAAQIATVKRIPFITVSPEDGLTRVFDPWIFRGVPADGEQARALLRWAFPEPAGHRVTLFVPTGRPGRERSAALEEACAELGVEVGSQVAEADAVLLWLDPEPARAAIEGLKRIAFDGPVLGSTRLDDPAFRIAAEGVALPLFGPEPPDASHLLDRQGYALVRSVAAAAEFADTPSELRRTLAEGGPRQPLFDSHGNRIGEIRVGVVRNGVVHEKPSR